MRFVVCYNVSDAVIDNGIANGSANGGRGVVPVESGGRHPFGVGRGGGVRQRVRIQDVAAAAGVSTQTVSRVLNHKPDVSPETRTRVLEVIQKMGYEPNILARGLASSKTSTLGLIINNLADPFYALILAEAEAEARRLDYVFLICSTEQNPSDELNFLKILYSRRVDGILLLALPSAEEQYRYLLSLHQEGMPVVSIASHLLDDKISYIDIDNVDGGYEATHCLIEAGRCRIAMITGPAQSVATEARFQGYCKALEEAGIPYDPALVTGGDWGDRSGYDGMNEIIRRGVLFDGLFAQNDRMAIAATHALRQAGWEIPRDVSIVGYDDIPQAAYAFPPLTTIHQPVQDLARTATRMLVDLVNNPEMEPRRVLLKPELIQRGSCGD